MIGKSTHNTWPGNLRELRNALQRGFVLADGGAGVDPMAGQLVSEASSSTPSSLLIPVGTPIPVAERLLILATLEKFEGDKKKAAAALHISLNTLYNRLSEYKAR
jgi:DNA-binding NtrC family response regulator